MQRAEALGAQADLLARLLGADVQHRPVGGQAGQDPEQQVDLPMPGSPASSTTEPGTRPAAEDAVELLRRRWAGGRRPGRRPR
jgi:hypothetical protein